MFYASAPIVHLSGMSVRLAVLSVCLSVCVSAFNLHDESFHYRINSRRSEDCTMCFGDDCWDLQRDRCIYYAQMNEVLMGNEAGGLPGDVDGLVHDMVGQAAASWTTPDCIPLISVHTDCNKENMCVGCQTCSCDSLGKWNCIEVQRCSEEPELNVDHNILVSVAEVLRNGKTLRNKRSTDNKPVKSAAPRNIRYGEISVKPSSNPDKTGRSINSMHQHHSKTTSTTEKDKIDSFENKTDYIEFDEVLQNIAIDNQNHMKRKLHQNETNYEFNDYMILDETVVVKNNETDLFVNMLNAIVDGNENTTTEPTAEESTKVVIDLLAPYKKDENFNFPNISNVDLTSNIIKEGNYDDDLMFDAVNIMKRDVSRDLSLNLTGATPRNNTNTTKAIAELINNVLIPLNKIIDDKEQELKDLIKIKNNLIQFIKEYNDSGSNLDIKKQEIINNTNTVLSIYNLDVFPEIQFNLRKISSNSLDKLLYKLKRDIYEVIKDVLGIKKLSITNNLPDDLRNLVRAMGVYVRKQGNVTNIVQNGIKLKNDINQRRQLSIDDNGDLNSTKDYLIKILEILDNDKPQSDALSSLSPTTRKIVKHVIKDHYLDDFSVIGLKTYGPEYNLTNDLRNIGNKWQVMTENIAASAPADKMYAIKLLHLALSVDINKLNDALALIDFASSRRMIPIEGTLGVKLLEKINRGLGALNDKIHIMIQYKASLANLGREHVTTIKPSKRRSFLKKIRNLLKGSKKDIVELVNKNVPRSQLIKAIAKKRLDDLAQKKVSEYEETIRRWQNALNVIPRNKRSLDLNGIQNKMNNIIPKYLRGKLNPAIAAKKLKKSRNTQNKATLKRSTNTKQRRITSTTVQTKIIPAKPKAARSDVYAMQAVVTHLPPVSNK